jgi:UDP-glucose 4-epimerase/UDP-glucuronate decarboxylase
MAKTLILGGAGFIGFHLAQALARQGEERVVLVDNLSRGARDAELRQLLRDHPQVSLRVGDLADPGTLAGLAERFDAVYLLAGMIGVRNVQRSPAEVLRTNARIILNTLDWLVRAGCGRLLFASTSEVYAGSVELGRAPVPTPEDVPATIHQVQHPRASYALSKLFGEAAVTHTTRAVPCDAVIVRYHNVYGPRMGLDHVIPELMERIWQRHDPLPVYGLEQTRAFCYVSDAVAASIALMRCPLSDCPIVHVGHDGQELSIRELLEKLLALTGYHPTIDERPAPDGAVARRCPDISRLKALTGYRPSVDLDEGLALTWRWYRQQFERTAGSASTIPAGVSR